ncbi:hypothetical protein CC78DRAFT_578850 [Lojkania enalia]|uniref:Uncharacterized protein n=1 Tax=Lojkania enalia TaxID=147567 RepID=A0A9P4KH24_9PLEO|nr:hypothetical protein CC78DRAFT_578850 [Didymosphaeria enalia]
MNDIRFDLRRNVTEFGSSIAYIEGLHGNQITPNGETTYYSLLTSNYLFSIPIPTSNLCERDESPLAAHPNISNHTRAQTQRDILLRFSEPTGA